MHDDFIHAYRFQVLTGLRPGELVGLRWADVKGGTVFISRAVNVLGEQTRGKNDNAVRAFVLSDLARACWNSSGPSLGPVRACSA